MTQQDLSDEEFLDDNLIDEEFDDDAPVSAAPAWIISLAVHALLLLVMSLIVFGSMMIEEEPPIRIAAVEPPSEDKKEDPVDRKIEEVPITVDDEKIVEDPVVTDLDVPVEDISTEDPIEDTVEPKGREEAVASVEAGGPAAFMAIGTNSNAAGLKGSRTGGKKRRGLNDGGGNRASESAVNAALMWFKRHQSDNGQWDVDGYMDNCQDNPKCEPGTSHTKDQGDGDAACTAYALLCFLGSGYDHKTPGRFKDTVKKGIDWLKQNQKADGGFGNSRNYENGVCAMALCEAYAMTFDATLKEPAQRAIDKLLANQAKTEKYEYGVGWNYAAATPTRNDSSVTGWCVMALKAAKMAGLDVGDGWEGSKAWFNGAWKAANPGKDPESLGSDDKSLFPYTWNAETDEVKGSSAGRASIGALCSVFLGNRPGDGILDSLTNSIMDSQVPTSYPTNTYYMYYNTLAIFQYDGEKWDNWNAQVRDLLVDAQHGRGSGCFDGSWDYEGTKFHGHEVGRLLSTAYCCLSLEVYYRFDRINKLK